MEAISIHLKENQGRRRKGEAYQLGVPLTRGSLVPETPVALTDPNSAAVIPCQSSPMAYWPDGSIRWLKLQFLGDLEPKQRRTLELHIRETSSTPSSLLKSERDFNGIAIDTGAAKFHVPANTPSWSHIGNGEPVSHQLSLTSVNGDFCQVEADGDWTIIEHGPVSLSCELVGWFLDGGTKLARFRFQLTFYRHSKTVEVQSCIHNPKRARHTGGLWDLGDPGSIHFNALTIRAAVPDIFRIRIAPEPESQAIELESKKCVLYQDSSGGENWDSLNHVNANGKVTTRFRGYRLYVNNDINTSGDRATPVILITSPKISMQATLPRFWQNFPSSLGVYDNQLIVGLFPDEAAEPYELQGGERKTQTAYLHYGEDPGALAWTLHPVVPVLDAKQYEISQAFPWFNADAPRGPLDDLIQLGLDGPSNFFAKREVIDEYGWRNFGDIFADHETLYQEADESPMISHYNNQYDAIYGFARQFALSGDPRWHELMDDLATHVRDIDIYHTEEDRAEYNNGLFWHTDHYLPAHTATHRTFSRHNATSSTPGQTGGGPAEEHCYSTGLLYHYCLTGCLAAREAVIELAKWIVIQREGDHCLLGQIDVARRREIPRLKATLKGQAPPDRQYPFTRGTGNYLNTLLDAYYLTLDESWLNQAETVIRSTVHPSDDLNERRLLDTEVSWSYLVFLSSLSRYISIKLMFKKLDENLRYAAACFQLYIDWIYNKEKPFLHDPSRLEFPNDTWTAQDIRKSMLLFQGAALLETQSKELNRAGEEWFHYVVSQLAKSRERQLARVQVILLQNFGPNTYSTASYKEPYKTMLAHEKLTIQRWSDQPRLSLLNAFSRFFSRMIIGVRKFNIRKEKAWIVIRLEGRKEKVSLK